MNNWFEENIVKKLSEDLTELRKKETAMLTAKLDGLYVPDANFYAVADMIQELEEQLSGLGYEYNIKWNQAEKGCEVWNGRNYKKNGVVYNV